MTDQPSAAPGWYADPHGRESLRYWDGAEWTTHTAATPGAAPMAAGAPGGVAPDGAAPKKRLSTGAIVAIVVGGAFALLIVIGILAAMAIPVFLSQREKAEDAAAKADVSTLGKEIATYHVDAPPGTPPVVESDGEMYRVGSAQTGFVEFTRSIGVELGGFSGTGYDDWCVWVTNPKGDVQDFQYSAMNGLEEGTCEGAAAAAPSGGVSDQEIEDAVAAGERPPGMTDDEYAIAVDNEAAWLASVLAVEVATVYTNFDPDVVIDIVPDAFGYVVQVDGTDYAYADPTPYAEFMGLTADGPENWCIWVRADDGKMKDVQYSSADGVSAGTCET